MSRPLSIEERIRKARPQALYVYNTYSGIKCVFFYKIKSFDEWSDIISVSDRIFSRLRYALGFYCNGRYFRASCFKNIKVIRAHFLLKGASDKDFLDILRKDFIERFQLKW